MTNNGSKDAIKTLHDTLLAQNFQISDLLEVIAGFTQSNQVVAFALTNHAKEILQEAQQENTEIAPAEVIFQAYYRTFFEEVGSRRFNTDFMWQRGKETMDNFANYLTNGIKEDALLRSSGSPTADLFCGSSARH